MADDALARQEQLAKDLGVRYAKQVSHSIDVMDVVDRTYALMRDPNTGALKHNPDIPDAEWNIHQDAMKPSRWVPFYLRAHQARAELYLRILGDRANAPTRLAQYVVKVFEKKEREYPVIDVKPVEK